VFWILWIIGQLWLFFGVEVVEVAKEFIEAVDRRECLIAVADMVFAELAGGIAEALEQSPNGWVQLAHAHGCAGKADLCEAGTESMLAGEKRGPTGGA